MLEYKYLRPYNLSGKQQWIRYGNQLYYPVLYKHGNLLFTQSCKHEQIGKYDGYK